MPSEVPEYIFHGTAFEQLSLVAHEIGHNNNAGEIRHFEPVCWLFGEQCGTSLMFSQNGFNGESLFLYVPSVAEMAMSPLLAEQLERAPDTP